MGAFRESPGGRRGPERFFYDKTTYTGVHTCGGPNTVCKDNFIASLRHGLKLSMFVRNPGLQPRSYPFNLPGGNKGPERFFYDRTSYTGVHQCGGPTVIDKENDFHGNFCRSLRPKSSQPHRSRPSDRDLQLHRSRPSDSNVRFLQSKTEDTAESLAHMRLALLNTRLERNRFGDLLPDKWYPISELDWHRSWMLESRWIDWKALQRAHMHGSGKSLTWKNLWYIFSVECRGKPAFWRFLS